MQALSPELAEEILDWLEFADILELRQCCKFWSFVNGRIWWKIPDVELHFEPQRLYIDSTLYGQRLQKSWPSVQYLKWISPISIFRHTLPYIAPDKLPQLKHLEVNAEGWYALGCYAVLTDLESITLRDCYRYGDDLLTFLNKARPLKFLYLYNCYISDTGWQKLQNQRCPQLEHLRWYSNKITDEGWRSFNAQVWPRLQTLAFESCLVTDQGWSMTPGNFPALTRLVVIDCAVLGEGWANFCQHVWCLQHLTLIRCSATQQTWAMMQQTCWPQLQTLTCKGIHWNLVKLAQGDFKCMPQLQTLICGPFRVKASGPSIFHQAPSTVTHIPSRTIVSYHYLFDAHEHPEYFMNG